MSSDSDDNPCERSIMPESSKAPITAEERQNKGNDDGGPVLSLTDIERAAEVCAASDMVRRTPTFEIPKIDRVLSERLFKDVRLYLKLESLQFTGSFKTRGLANVLENMPDDLKSGKRSLVTMSAGNFGRSFATAAKRLGIPAVIFMPDTAPVNRKRQMEALGATVERVPASQLMARVDACVREKNMHFVHPFDDPLLIAGHGTMGLEILEDVPDADVIVVNCGGGGMLAGIATAVKLSGSKAHIIGVEPHGSPSMYISKQRGCAHTLDSKQSAPTIAAGLAPPMAGTVAYRHCNRFVDEILLVTDAQIAGAVKLCVDEFGLAVEPSAVACLAALLSGKGSLANMKGKKIVCVVCGRNSTLEELRNITEPEAAKGKKGGVTLVRL